MKRIASVAVATALLLGTAGIAQAATLQAGAAGTQAVSGFAVPAATASTKTSWTRARVVRWVDGDTVVTTKGTIRLIGVDTPERGRCGATKATRSAKAAAPRGSVVRLGNPRSVDNKDRYDRKLRYVVRKSTKVDISAKQIRKGSKERYDSKDGYDWHPRQAKYRRLDRNNADYRCGSTSKPAAPVANSWQARANMPVSSANPDINCGDIPSQYRPVRISGPDYHGLDRDGDGWGCDV